MKRTVIPVPSDSSDSSDDEEDLPLAKKSKSGAAAASTKRHPSATSLVIVSSTDNEDSPVKRGRKRKINPGQCIVFYTLLWYVFSLNYIL